MRPTLTTATLVVLSFALAAPSAAAQESSVAITLEPEADATVVDSKHGGHLDMDVRVTYPPLTTCLQPAPVHLTAKGPAGLRVAMEPSELQPESGLRPAGDRFEGESALKASLEEIPAAGEFFVATILAHGGGCDDPVGPAGDAASTDVVFRAAYEPGMEATTMSLEPAGQGTHLWTIRFTNLANAATQVVLQGEGGVHYDNLPEHVTLPAPTEDRPEPSTDVDILVRNPVPFPQKAVIRFEYGPNDESLARQDGAGELVVEIPADGDSAATLEAPAAELPGFELIPLLAALGAAALHRRR